MLVAISSPSVIAFRSHEYLMRKGRQTRSIAPATYTSPHLVPERLPNIQCTTTESSSSDAIYCRKEVRPLKRNIKAIPASMSVSAVTPLILAIP